jgi:hypothetical protein
LFDDEEWAALEGQELERIFLHSREREGHIALTAREWLERGAAATDAFDAFSNFWRGFNALFAGPGQEREQISNFISTAINDHFAQEMLNAHADEVGHLMGVPVIDMRGNGRDTSQHIETFGTAASAIEKLVAVFMVIYQIRCNFEHGQKSPSQVRDQLLCKAACPFISGVVRHVVQ